MMTKETKTAEVLITEAKIGDVAFFREIEYNRLITFYRESLLPAINDFANAYKQLNIGPFTEEVFKKSKSNPDFISLAYAAAVEEDVKFSKMQTAVIKNTFINAIEDDLRPIFQKRREILALFDEPKSASGFKMEVTPEWSDVVFREGSANIFPEEIKKRFQVVIKTQKQLEIWNKLHAFQTHWIALVDFINENGYNQHGHPIYGIWGMTHVNIKTGYLEIDPNFIEASVFKV